MSLCFADINCVPHRKEYYQPGKGGAKKENLLASCYNYRQNMEAILSILIRFKVLKKLFTLPLTNVPSSIYIEVLKLTTTKLKH